MADLEKTVAIIFEGVDEMGAGISSATRKIDGFADNVEQIAAPLASVTKALLAMEGAAAGMAIAFGTKAYEAAIKFEAAQADLAKTLSDSDGSVDQFTDEITRLSNVYGESSTELLQSMANYRQAGFTAEESLGLVKSGLDLVIAGDVEAAEASEILVASLKGFKAPASDAGQLLEVLNASSNTYATNVSELAAGMARLSPIASTLGLDFEQTAELLIPVIEVFRSGPEAANALRTGLLRLGDDSGPVVETLEQLGIQQRDANGALRSNYDILNDVAAATGDLTEADKLFVAQQLFGIEQAPKMVEVLGAIESSSIDVSKALQESTSVLDEVNIRLETGEKVADRTATAWENLARTIGLEFKDEMKGVVDAIGEIFRAFEGASADGALDDFFNELNPILAEVERLAREIAQALPTALAEADYSGFANGLNALFGDLEDVEITADDLRAVIEGLGDGFEALSEFTAGTFEVFKGFIAVVKPVVEAFTSLDSETQKWLGIIGGLSLAVSPAMGALTTLSAAVGALGGKGGVFALAAGSSKTLAQSLTGTGKLGLVGAAGIAVVALADLYTQLEEFNEFRFTFSDELKEELDETTGAQKKATELGLFSIQKLAEGYGSLSDRFGWGEEAAADFKVVSTEAINAALKVAEAGEAMETEGAAAAKVLSTAALEAAKEVAGLSEAIGKAGGESEGAGETFDKAFRNMVASAVEATTAWEDLGDGVYGARENFEEVDGALESLRAAFKKGLVSEDTFKELEEQLLDVRDGGNAGALALEKLGGETKDAGEEAKKGVGKFKDLQKTILELTSDERIKAMEFSADIKVAELEADAEKVKAVFSSMETTIESTGKTLAELTGDLAGLSSGTRKYNDLMDIAEDENERREKSIKVQNDYVKAMTENLRERTKKLASGEGLIKIDSEGLEPALEMIMWQIIEKVQLRANAEGAEFLLGLNSGGA